MDQEEEIQVESTVAFEWLMHRYGDRVSPDMVQGLRASVEAVVKTVAAIRKVSLANGDAPLLGFTPGTGGRTAKTP